MLTPCFQYVFPLSFHCFLRIKIRAYFLSPLVYGGLVVRCLNVSKTVFLLIPFENVTRIYLRDHVIEARVVAVGDDGVRLVLELLQVVDHYRAEEGAAVGERGLVDDHPRALGLHPLHHALDAALPEVVAVRLHREPIDADDALLLIRGIIVATVVVVVVARLLQHLVGDEVLARAVALHDGRHHVLRHVGIVGQQLLGVLRQTVAAVAEARVVVVRADTRVEADAVDDTLRVQAFHLGVGIQLVEVADAQREVGVGKELHGLGFGAAHEEHGHLLFDGALLDDGREGVRRLLQRGLVVTHNDAARVEVVVQGLALAEELRGEDDVRRHDLDGAVRLTFPAAELLAHAPCVAHGDGALDDHRGGGVDFQHFIDNILHSTGVEEVLGAVVVRRGGDDHELGVAVARLPVQRGPEVQRLVRQVFLDVVVLDGRLLVVDHLHALGHDVHGGDGMMLREQRRDTETDVTGPCNGDIHGWGKV